MLSPQHLAAPGRGSDGRIASRFVLAIETSAAPRLALLPSPLASIVAWCPCTARAGEAWQLVAAAREHLHRLPRLGNGLLVGAHFRAGEGLSRLVLSHDEGWADAGAALSLLDERCARIGGTLDPVVQASLELMTGGRGLGCASLARAAGLSSRQLRRRFTRALGLGPKQALRICRLRAALDAAVGSDELSWSSVAHDHGYADQPHLVREFVAFTRLSPRRLVGTESARELIPAGLLAL